MVNEKIPVIHPHQNFSAIGFTSFIMALGSTIAMLLLSIMFSIIEQPPPGETGQASATAVVISIMIFTLMFVNLISCFLGIIGLAQKNSKKNLSFWGVFISVSADLIACILMLN